ncbi:hypothetical protein [Bythopirellula goksoeyrii]|uniref:PEP-CTERM protein-sorting domain-containing protein n=1 Tax=Bythopirellula goksoeyrii TaxID=1400387 RepID=A0A5B9QCG2_9BACT|nr:hypothetical protein [Bythopirellula goksoeyrii]QEG35152.1 hypothetical protein Pr1d_24430 [Bythopirellula goksoeyrii]
MLKYPSLSVRSMVMLAMSVCVLYGTSGLPFARAVVLLDETFDSSPVDGIPNSISLEPLDFPSDFILGTGNPGSDLKVAGPSGSYTDPFGGTGNKSLVLHSFDGGCFAGDPGCSTDLNEFPVVTWLDEFGDDPTVYRDGIIEFDMILSTPEPTETWTLLDFRLGWGGVNRINPQTIPPDVVIWNQYQVQNDGENIETLIFNPALNQGQGISFPNENPLEPDVPFRVKYTLDGATETFQWELTNLNTSVTTPLTFDDSSSNISGGSATEAIWPWGFGDFGAAINYLGYNSLDFQQDFGNQTSEVYIDNVYVNSSVTSENGDFDNDGDVDGADFLKWQRGMSPNPGSAGDLELWQTTYGSGPLVAPIASIPEPASIGLLVMGSLYWIIRRQFPS